MPVQLPNIIKRNLIVRKQAPVQREELSPDQCGEWQRGEGLRESLEEALIVFGLAFAFKAICAVHVVCLVVAAVHEEMVRIQPLVRIEQESHFGGPGTAVDEVTVEEVDVCFGGVAI